MERCGDMAVCDDCADKMGMEEPEDPSQRYAVDLLNYEDREQAMAMLKDVVGMNDVEAYRATEELPFPIFAQANYATAMATLDACTEHCVLARVTALSPTS